MNKILFIVPYPYQQAPSQRFRFEQYKSYFEQHGFIVEYAPFYSEKAWEILYQNKHFSQKIIYILLAFLKRFFLLFQLRQYRYLFIHREVAPLGPPVFEYIISKVLRRKFIYDFDDAIWLPNYSKANARFEKLKAYSKVNKIMRWANQISAGNNYLANYAQQYNRNVQVIPTTIDTVNYHNQTCKHEKKPIVIGWTGSHSTMRYLNFIIPILQRLEEKYVFIFQIISDKAPSFELKSLKFINWNKATEIDDLAQIQIGIMPLSADKWANGKCGFKGLQYMALEIPTIMSPVGVNTEIINDGVNGFLANSTEEWLDKISQLIESEGLRKKMGVAGRKTIVEKYSVLANRDKYLELFNRLAE